jgi:uncharacterized protein DUF6011
MTDRKETKMTTTVFYTQHELTAAEIRQDEVRNAAIARNRGKATPKPFKFRDPGAPANDAQKGKVWALLATLKRLDHTTWKTASVWISDNIDNPIVFTMEMASKTIDRLKLRIEEAETRGDYPTDSVTSTGHAPTFITPANRAPRDPFTDVPDGYYAVTTDEGHLAFYRVSTWKKSGDRKVQVQASDELHPVKGHKAIDAILAKIRTITYQVAGKRYADEIGNCYRCGRTLTDEESRRNGIGPVCINK